jgi:predicted DNA-binding protein YlxM (UPF0122 family)
MKNEEQRYTFSEFAALTGLSEEILRQKAVSQSPNQAYFSIQELANRWRCSRGTVYNRLRTVEAKVLDFSTAGKKSRKAVSAQVVLEIETRKTKRLP